MRVSGRLVRDVPASAVNVLRQFRLQTGIRRLWIDAICINQADDQERSAQVSMMHKIYRNTQRALIWVGPAVESIDITFQDLEKLSISAYPRMIDETFQLVEGADPKKIVDETGVRSFEALVELFDRAWFHRIWVLQECYLPSESLLKCGRFETDWTHVCRAAASLMYSLRLLTARPNEMKDLTGFTLPLASLNIGFWGRDIPSVIELYTKSYGLRSTDPRDKFYAIHGTSVVSAMTPSEQSRLGLAVDYTRPLFAVIRDATRFILTEEYGFQILERPLAGSSDSSCETNSPSWVPRWDVINHLSRESLANIPTFESYGNPDIDLIALDVGTNRLVLKGFEINLVTCTLPALNCRRNEDKYRRGPGMFTFFRENAADIVAFFQCYYNFFSRAETMHFMDDVVRMITNHCDYDSKPLPGFLKLMGDAVYVEALAQPTPHAMQSFFETHGTCISHRSWKRLDTMSRYTVLTSSDNRLFLTNEGFVGLAPKVINVGDTILGFLGARGPFVMRQYLNDTSAHGMPENGRSLPSESSSAYRLLGQCGIPALSGTNIMQALAGSGQRPKAFKIW